jgi:TP901-1 family phage major tail protein
MTANVGRATMLFWGDESPQPLVAGVREKGITLNGEAVDITNDDSAGWRSLLDKAGVNSVDIPVSGVLVGDVLRADWFAGASAIGSRMQAARFVFHDGGELNGNFYLQNYSETGAHDGEITFEASFMSNGVVTYTPAA